MLREIEQAIIAAIDATEEFPTGSVMGYNREPDEQVPKDMKKTPGALVVYGGTNRVERKGYRRSRWHYWIVFLVDKSLKPSSDESHQIYELMDPVLEALEGKDFGLRIHPLEFMMDSLISGGPEFDRKFTMARQVYRTCYHF